MKKLLILMMISLLAFGAVGVSAACIDADEDGYDAYDSVECPTGTDCNDNNPNSWQYLFGNFDGDGDGYHKYGASNMNAQDQIMVCTGAELPESYTTESLGRDCNDNNPNSWQYLFGYVDADGDGYNRFGLANMNAQDQIMVCTGAQLPPTYSETTDGRDFCDDNALEYTEVGCTAAVPEFGAIGALIVLAGAGLIVFRKRQ